MNGDARGRALDAIPYPHGPAIRGKLMNETPVRMLVSAKKAVVFDLFHTLTSIESSWCRDLPSTSEVLGVDRDAWNDQLLVRSRDRLVGAKTDPFTIIAEMARAIDPTLSDERIKAATENRLVRMTGAITDISHETVAVLESLKAQGKLLGLISNADAMEIAAWGDNNIHHLFDSTIFSCRVGLAKPERAIYDLSLRELGVPAADAVFVGDGGSDELQAARDAGMTAIMITGIVRELWPEQIAVRRAQADFVIERLSELVAVGDVRCVLFDWGDTLMVDFPEYSGTMASWPRVQAVARAHETLDQVRALGWRTALATNASDSHESDIRAALTRVGLNSLIDRVYCSLSVGHSKPSSEFFAFIQNDLGLTALSLVMVGDNYAKDVEGANRCGIRAVWLRPGCEPETGPAYQTIADLAELPTALESLGRRT
jgi:HAD superfamily hydrolase (TIGR01509 family)